METVKVKGVVGSGRALGRRLGYPTANIYGVEAVDAPDGVYAVEARIEGKDGVMFGMANFGRRPTVNAGGDEKVLEVHFFDFEGNLYGLAIEVRLCKYIRPESAFVGTDELEKQLRRDETSVREFFGL